MRFNRKIKVLIFPCGSENALEIYESLKYSIHLDVYGASGKSDHGKYAYPKDKYIEGDLYITNPAFIDELNKIIDSLGIDIVIPTHDTIALYLAKYKKELNAKVVVSDYETAKIAREKKLTYEVFKNEEFCPITYSEVSQIETYPVFLKPNQGEGAKGTFLAYSEDDVVKILEKNKDTIICEYLEGEEITVDCFTNKKGELLFIGPRSRERIQMGIAFHSKSLIVTEEIEQICQTINSRLSFRGPWFLQLKKDRNNRYKLMEVSTRQAGTMTLYRQIGVNFALLGVFDVLDQEVSIMKNNLSIELDRCLMNRYKIEYNYTSVYIDFDDTLIINGKINETLMKFIYQCINDNIKVILITKHAYDIHDTLKRFRISENVFDEIICLKEEEEKSGYILPTGAIFIDNYFKERQAVHKILNIPVFDVDAVGCLLK